MFGLDISMPVAMLVAGYLLGSIPFGLIVTRLGGAGDLRQIGSGNIGATNVLRTGRRELAALTLLLDMGKGAAAVLLAAWIWPVSRALRWHRRVGGLLRPSLPGLAALPRRQGHRDYAGYCAGAGLADRTGRRDRMAGRRADHALLVGWRHGRGDRRAGRGGLFGRFDLALLFLALALMVLWKHRGNIARLLAGREPRIGEAA